MEPNSQNPPVPQYEPSKIEIGIALLSAFTVFYNLLFRVGFQTQKYVYDKNLKIEGVQQGYFGYMKDTSDRQWRHYSESFYITLSAAIGFLIIKKIIKRFWAKDNSQRSISIITKFYTFYGAILVLIMFHAGVVYWTLLTYLYFVYIEKFYNSKFFAPILWTFVILNLYLNEITNGFDLEQFFNPWGFGHWFDISKNDDSLVRWNVIFNMTILRVVSYGFDKRWAHSTVANAQKNQNAKESAKKGDNNEVDDLKARYQNSLPLNQYQLEFYYAYLLYSPIFLSGPPITFNAWISQIYQPLGTTVFRNKIKYLLRTIFLLISFEFWLHLNFSYAICTEKANRKLWESFPQLELMLSSMGVLIFIWFKFNSFWKVSRCWALWDDIEVPENLNRCICNNYNFEGFWRSWHRGFNQWLIRYIFIPLGGSKNKIWNIWIVFIFVALWHDFNLNLVLWAVGICLFLMPEIIVKSYFKQQQYHYLWQKRWWFILCGFSGAVYIILMVIANLIGFGFGYEALLEIFNHFIFTYDGIISFIQILIVLTGTSQFMYWFRSVEEDGNSKGF